MPCGTDSSERFRQAASSARGAVAPDSYRRCYHGDTSHVVRDLDPFCGRPKAQESNRNLLGVHLTRDASVVSWNLGTTFFRRYAAYSDARAHRYFGRRRVAYRNRIRGACGFLQDHGSKDCGYRCGSAERIPAFFRTIHQRPYFAHLLRHRERNLSDLRFRGGGRAALFNWTSACRLELAGTNGFLAAALVRSVLPSRH